MAKTAPQPQESFGQRVTRLRKERGLTQVELADKSGMIQALVSDYERDKLRPYADVAVRLALALDVSTDELLGLAPSRKHEGAGAPRRFLRRLPRIVALPKREQDALLRTIDAFLKPTKRTASG